MKLYIWICLLMPTYVLAQGGNNITGKWKTIDDESGEAKSVVKIYEKEGKYYGKIVKLFRAPGEDPDPVCEDCPEDDPRYKEKIIGMEIIKDLKKEGDEYIEGTVLKPDEGRIYKCKLWLENNNLKVRGYWGFLYRTQTWVRTE
ncbi:DUF2147 domain-containing protein [Fulvivirga kasyanovii]|uniref:DUF2147 domain-containing protein n=1 Tax=Fulvivirga kasyanovii TaxID=396812 RepID=A0ABW9RRQ4_9BACT|nr:DUF2147 domain-containing protein [Fulvivirga kasyanovii]MTI25730.1 DUF2147 domain-containing protein [Fulvivirga kasyanovii]